MKSKRTISYFARQNKRYHQRIVNSLGNEKKFKLALVSRKKYFQTLTQLPLFKRLLAKRRNIVLTLSKKKQVYNICKLGVNDVNFVLAKDVEAKNNLRVSDEELDDMIEARIAFVIDPLKRVRYFFKPTEEHATNASWQEIRPIIRIFDDGAPVVYAKKRALEFSDNREAIQLSMYLKMHEKEIDFSNNKDKIRIRNLLEIQRVM